MSKKAALRPSTTETTDEPVITITSVKETVSRYYPTLLPSVKCALAVVATMAFRNRTKPLSVIFETPSGYGKSAVLQMLYPIPGNPMGQYIYRSDKFTPRSFVSHSANVPRKQLGDIDLLPRLKNKTLVTKELSPLFRGREDDLRDTFSTLIAVLDGCGFLSDSGAQGQRGYSLDVVFNWLGATTPLPPQTHRLMSQLGTRLLFFETPSLEPTEKELLAYTEKDDASDAEDECQQVVNSFLTAFFDSYRIGTVEPDSVSLPVEVREGIARYAKLLTYGRREIHSEKVNGNWTPIAAGTPEGPWKVVNYFKELARGHALIHGRNVADSADLDLVAEVAVSSIPIHLRPIIRELRRSGSITSTKCAAMQRVSQTTARRYLRELEFTGIASRTPGSASTNEPDVLLLSPEFSWLCPTLNTKCSVCVGEEESNAHREHLEFEGPADGLPDIQKEAN